MKYIIFGCMLILLGIAAIQHESAKSAELQNNPQPPVSNLAPKTNHSSAATLYEDTDKAMARFMNYPVAEPDTQMQPFVRSVHEGG